MGNDVTRYIKSKVYSIKLKLTFQRKYLKLKNKQKTFKFVHNVYTVVFLLLFQFILSSVTLLHYVIPRSLT